MNPGTRELSPLSRLAIWRYDRGMIDRWGPAAGAWDDPAIDQAALETVVLNEG